MFICLSETVNQDDLVRKDTHWWTDLVDEEKHKTMLEISGKLVLLFEILRMAEGLGDKVLVLLFLLLIGMSCLYAYGIRKDLTVVMLPLQACVQSEYIIIGSY